MQICHFWMMLIQKNEKNILGFFFYWRTIFTIQNTFEFRNLVISIIQFENCQIWFLKIPHCYAQIVILYALFLLKNGKFQWKFSWFLSKCLAFFLALHFKYYVHSISKCIATCNKLHSINFILFFQLEIELRWIASSGWNKAI